MTTLSRGALQGLRIVDLTDERGIYGAKLLADLGADVVRPEPPTGDPLRQRGPFAGPDHGGESLYYAFFASSRRSFQVDVATEAGRAQLGQLISRADGVLTGGGLDSALDWQRVRADHPHLVHIDVSSFGDDGPWRDYLAPDLVAGALGGAVATTGDADTTPLKAFGELNFMVSGAYVAIAALAALYAREEGGSGQRAMVPVHECIASCLEQVFMFYWYAEALQRPEGKVLPRRGPTHWSNAYTVVNGANGSIMVTPTPDFDTQLAWLIEAGAHEDLIDEKYQKPENLRARIARTMQILENWVADQDVEALFFEAQRRHIPYGWVQPLERMAENPQLMARQWFVDHVVDGASLRGAGAPYRFSETPWRLSSGQPAGPDNAQILAEVGWEVES